MKIQFCCFRIVLKTLSWVVECWCYFILLLSFRNYFELNLYLNLLIFTLFCELNQENSLSSLESAKVKKHYIGIISLNSANEFILISSGNFFVFFCQSNQENFITSFKSDLRCNTLTFLIEEYTRLAFLKKKITLLTISHVINDNFFHPTRNFSCTGKKV